VLMKEDALSSQLGFIDYIAHPLWETWGELVHPDCVDVLDNLQSNREYFNSRVQQQQGQQDQDSGQGPAVPVPVQSRTTTSRSAVVEEENEELNEDGELNQDANR